MNIYDCPTYRKSLLKIAKNLPDKKSSILVTGACGLIGSCIVDALLINGYNVYALELKKERLIHRFGNETNNLHFIEQSIWNSLANELEFDYIIHLASFADPKSYALYPVETILTNVLGAKSVLDYCKNHKQTRVLISSTFETYGKLEKDEYSEDDYGLIDFNQIRSCYPESKRTAEILSKSYIDEYDINALIIRFSSIYGPTMLNNDSKAHAQFLFKAINNEDIVLKSGGLQKRTYTYVIDAVDALFKVLFFGAKGETYNIANKNSIVTIAEVAKTIAKIANVDVVFDLPDEIEKKGFSKPQNCILITDKLENLNWQGSYNLEQGMKETYDILLEAKKC